MTTYKRGYFMWDEWNDDILITNDMGQFAFLTRDEFSDLMTNKLVDDSETYNTLLGNGMIYTESDDDFANEWSDTYANRKSCLFTATQLFIVVLTSACNQQCVYCQASAGNNVDSMSWDTARKAIDIAFQSPAYNITIEFQGGEPTLNAPVLRESVLYAKQKAAETGKNLSLAIVTNLTNADEVLLDWLVEQSVHISSSLDGTREIHNTNRPMKNGEESYAKFMQGCDMYEQICIRHGIPQKVQPIQTTTRHALTYGRQIVDEYLSHGINCLYIRALTPLGCALALWDEIGYTADEYLYYYCDMLDYMIQCCLAGNYVWEVTASIYLKRILLNDSVGHTEFRSPCGAGVGQMAINHDGNIYTCDEGRMLAAMGDHTFMIGDIENTYDELIRSRVVHATCISSCVECLPGCSDCVYSPYCAVCPVVTYGLENDIISHEPVSAKCAVSKGIIRYLFELIKRNESDEMDVLYRWARS